MSATTSAAGAAATAVTAYAVLRRFAPEAARRRLERTNFAGQPVTLAEGPAAVAGLAAGALLSARPTLAGWIAGVGLLGLVDDLAGSGDSRGLRGHLRALARAQVTTGALKVVGLGCAGLFLARKDQAPALVLLDAALIAGGANLLNLFDLRPGRALKVALLTAAPLCGQPVAAAAVSTSLALLPRDLAGASMLGDTGANALGLVVGAAYADRSLTVRTAAAVVVIGLTLASERVSFSQVIARTRPLRVIDEWGRAR